jgi:hypothetical protein
MVRIAATAAEHAGPVAGDDLVPDARLIATRCIDISAPPHEVFPWLRQMGFGRAGWYSWDIIDNLGRRSARRIHPEWQHLAAGDIVPGGPVDFIATVVDPPRRLVITLSDAGRLSRRVPFSLAYELRDAEVDGTSATRLVTRVRARVDVPGGRLMERLILGPGDGMMVRRQLRNLARRAEGRTPG